MVNRIRFWLLLGGTFIASAVIGIIIFNSVKTGQRLRNEHPEGERLSIVTYPSFTSLFGPAPELIKIFKNQCNCDVDVVNAGDSVVMLQRLEQHKDQFTADLVLGLDSLTIHRAQKNLQWKSIHVDHEGFAPEVADSVTTAANESFIPFDWSAMTFIYREGEIAPPQSLMDLKDPRFRNALALQNPLTSTPGLQFVLWCRRVFNDGALDFFKGLQPSVAAMTDSWSTAYGLFKRGQAKLVFSYETSVIFHWTEEHDHKYQAADLRDGHPIQIEYAAIPANCRNCTGAEKFIHLLLSPEGQKLLMNKNYMRPVFSQVESGTEFAHLKPLKVLPWSQVRPDFFQIDAYVDQAVKALK